MEEEKTQVEESEQTPQTKRIVINIERYQHLIEALDDRSKVRRIVVSVFCIGLLLFTAITIIMLTLKSFFPYSDISTSAFGTTTITDEKKQVSYFLFNTADLWANSGVFVKEGDIISVHSSGSSNTAIHHIHSASTNNTNKRELNYGPLGERLGRESKRDRLRRQFRIFPNYPSDALIMQVVDPNTAPNAIPSYPTSSNTQNFYYIGAQRDNIHIVKDGVLHFAVNDIVLDSTTILKMIIANMAVMADIEKDSVEKGSLHYDGKLYFNECIWKKIVSVLNDKDGDVIHRDILDNDVERTFDMKKLDMLIKSNTYDTIQDIIITACAKDSLTLKRYCILMKDNNSMKFGGYEAKDFTGDLLKTEMDYYWEHKYKKAWYDDNVGSFLILVEKDNRNRLSNGE